MTAVLPDLHPGIGLLTVTTRSVPPGVVVVAACGEVDLVTAPLLKDRLLVCLRPARRGRPLRRSSPR